MVTQVITLLYRTRVVCRFAVLRNCSHHFCGPTSTRMIHHPRESHQPSNASKSLPLVAKTFVEKTKRSSHMKQGEGKMDPWGKWKNIGRVEPPHQFIWKKRCASQSGSSPYWSTCSFLGWIFQETCVEPPRSTFHRAKLENTFQKW